MSFWGTLGGALWGTNVDEETTRAQELDAKIKAQNEAALARGKWTPEQFEVAEANRIGMSVASDYDPDLWGDFAAGAEEGLASMQEGVKGAVNSTVGWTLKGVFGFVPAWLWLVAGVAALAYFAWPQLLRKFIKF